MNRRHKSLARQSTRRKKPYRPPKLTVHGDIRALTRSKKGTNFDGTGKPRTKSGVSAT